MTKRTYAHAVPCVVAVLLAGAIAGQFAANIARADIAGAGPSVPSRLSIADGSLFILRQQKSNATPPTSSATNAALPAADPLVARAAPQRSAEAEKPIVVAPAKAVAAATVAHQPAAPVAAGVPARFFTINQVLANRGQTRSDAVRLAAIDPKTLTDAAPPVAAPAIAGTEPFGLSTFRAPDGLLWTKWRKVEADIQAEAPTLARCRAMGTQCTLATFRFVAIIKAAEAKQGRARLEEVNRRVNEAIRYTSDIAQWGVPDLWSPPLSVDGKGSFDTGRGDCEDYAIAKYVALREAGVPAKDLRVLLVRDKVINTGHAVLAAREDGRWVVMDNRFDRILAENDADFLVPLFAIDAEGVKLFAAPYASRDAGRQDMIAGSGAPPARGALSSDASWGD
ncbi:MAG TPA: transglutaminase-like cysteine peptidase [Pseudolabrys sp.]|nr:transglutaminase-like cysteine peptidase [Pseudolabrys sp.]